MNEEAIIAATRACIRKANKLFKVDIPVDLSIRFLKLDVASYCWWNPFRPERKRQGIQFDKFVAETQPFLITRIIIPHEVAHLVMHQKQYVQGLLPYATDHGKEWGAICAALGGVHSDSVPAFSFIPRLLRDSIYHKVTTDSKFVVYVTKFRYNEIQKGQKFRLIQTREVIGKRHVSKVPVKRSRLISELKLCYIHRIIRV